MREKRVIAKRVAKKYRAARRGASGEPERPFAHSYVVRIWIGRGDPSFLAVGWSERHGPALSGRGETWAHEPKFSLYRRVDEADVERISAILLGAGVVAGYGYTTEPDFVFVLDAATGAVEEKTLVPSGPDEVIVEDGRLYVRTYDHDVVFDVR